MQRPHPAASHGGVLITPVLITPVLDDGSAQDYSAGDVMLLPPGHDAWTVGDEPARFVEFSRGNDYYAG